MHWELIPVIVIAVWILSNLLRNKEDDSQTKPAGSGKPFPGRQRAGATEIDRFLEEIQRRRRQSQEERREESIPEVIPAAPPRPGPDSPRSRRQPRPAAPPPVVQRRPLREQTYDTLPEVIPVAEAATPAPPAAQVWPSLAQLQAEDAFPTRESRPLQPLSIGSAGRLRPVSPAIAQVRALLRTPQAMQTAIILREILDVPRSRRQSRGLRVKS